VYIIQLSSALDATSGTDDIYNCLLQTKVDLLPQDDTDLAW
jgi:hypothetical protein